jgi:hypothetical protein
VGFRTVRRGMVIFAGLLAGSCGSPFAAERDDAFPEHAEWAVSDARLAEFTAAFGYSGRLARIPAGQRQVVRTADVWAAAWQGLETWEAPPRVDFAREMIILVTEPWGTEVDDATHIQVGVAGDALRIFVSRIVWRDGCYSPPPRISLPMEWSSARAIIVPRSHRPVEFLDRRVRRRCPPGGLDRDVPSETTGTSLPTPRP